MPYTPETDVQKQAAVEVAAANNVPDAVNACLAAVQMADPEALNSDLGGVVYSSLMANPHLSEREKQVASCLVGRVIVADEVVATAQPETFLRNTTPRIKFVTAALEDKASRYINAVHNEALAIGAQNAHLFGADRAQLVDVTHDLLNAFHTQQHQLSQDACEFLATCAEVTPGQQGQAMLMVNALMLTTTMPAVMEATMNSRHADPAAWVAFEANLAAQGYANSIVSGQAPTNAAARALTNDPRSAGLGVNLEATMQMAATNNVAALRANAPAHVPTVAETLKQALGRDTQSRLNQAEAKLQRRQQKLDNLITNRDQNLRMGETIMTHLAANAGTVTPNEFRQATHTVREMQEEAKKLSGKIQDQRQKVDNSEKKVEHLQSKIARR